LQHPLQVVTVSRLGGFPGIDVFALDNGTELCGLDVA
jgi:hypothetical protein